MHCRCPKCKYDFGISYPMTKEEWYPDCPKCGKVDLEFFHFAYPYNPRLDHWILLSRETGKVIGIDPCDIKRAYDE